MRLLPRASFERRCLSFLRLAADVEVVSLMAGAELAAVAQDSWLVHAEGAEYPQTRDWGHWIRRGTAPWAQGFVWPSKREPSDRVAVLFEDRFGVPPRWSRRGRNVSTSGRGGERWLNGVLAAYWARGRRGWGSGVSWKPYDLQVVLLELEQMGAGGLVSGADVARLVSLVLDRLGCDTAASAYDRLYRDWCALPEGTPLRGFRAGQILSVLPVLRLGGLQTTGDEAELLHAVRAQGPADPRWQANVAVLASTSGVLDFGQDVSEMEAAMARIEEARAVLPEDAPEREAFDVAHAALRVHLSQRGGGEDEMDSAVADLERLRDSPMFSAEQRAVVQGQIAVFRSHQAARAEDEESLVNEIRVIEGVVAHLATDHMDRPTLESGLENARGNLAYLRARRTGRFEPVGERGGARTAEDVRSNAAAMPSGVRATVLIEAGSAAAVRRSCAVTRRGFWTPRRCSRTLWSCSNPMTNSGCAAPACSESPTARSRALPVRRSRTGRVTSTRASPG
ncbi:RES domain-containing protein [Streptomyces zhihengii]